MSELQTSANARWKWYHFWPVALPVVLYLAVYLASLFNANVFEWFFRMDEKAQIDDFAPYVLLLPAILYWVRCMVTRNPLYTIMMVAATTLMLRELHWDPAIKIAAYPVLIGCFVWMVIWSDALSVPFNRDRKHTVMLVATLIAYLVAQFAEKRIIKFELEADIDKFRDGVDAALAQAVALKEQGLGQAIRVVDDQLHSKFEELTEMFANVMLAIASLIGSWKYCDAEQKFIPLSDAFATSPSKKLLDALKPKAILSKLRRRKAMPASPSAFVPDLGQDDGE